MRRVNTSTSHTYMDMLVNNVLITTSHPTVKPSLPLTHDLAPTAAAQPLRSGCVVITPLGPIDGERRVSTFPHPQRRPHCCRAVLLCHNNHYAVAAYSSHHSDQQMESEACSPSLTHSAAPTAAAQSSFASRMSHSCQPNCNTMVVSANGRLSIAMYALRDILVGTTGVPAPQPDMPTPLHSLPVSTHPPAGTAAAARPAARRRHHWCACTSAKHPQPAPFLACTKQRN